MTHLHRAGRTLVGLARKSGVGPVSGAPARRFSDAAGSSHTTVCAVDPLFLVEASRAGEAQEEEARGGARCAVRVRVPSALVPVLSRGSFSLGDADDPHSQWAFGTRGEVFDYRYVGSHAVESGMCALADGDWADRVLRGEESAALTWRDVLRHLESDAAWPRGPLLFVGRLVDCATAGVYVLPKSGPSTGLLVSSEY